MKVQKPAREVEVCDICHHEKALLHECVVCGKEYCLTCEATIAGCWVRARVGRCCAKRADVLAVMERYAKEITPVIDARLVALGLLPAEPPKGGESDE